MTTPFTSFPIPTTLLDGATVTASGSITPRSLSTRFGEVFNVKDYGAVGNGLTNDTNAIQQCINSAPDYSTIYFPSGIYMVDTSGLSILSRNGLLFTGPGIIKFSAAASIPLGSIGNFHIVFNACTKCSVQNMVLQGNNQEGGILGYVNCTDCSTMNNNISGVGGVTANVSVCSIGGVRTQFVGNTIHDSTSGGALFCGNVNTLEVETNAQVIRNHCYNISNGGGCYIVATGGLMSENICHNTSNSGVVVSGGTGKSIGIMVSNNLCYTNGFHGVQIDAASGGPTTTNAQNITITGNVCHNNTSSGIFLSYSLNTICSNNVCFDNTNYGIAGDTSLINATISGNSCFDTRVGGARVQGPGIQIVSSSTTGTVSGLTISGNNCYNHSGPGINVQANTSCSIGSVNITGNTCKNNSQQGIIVTEATNNSVVAFVSDNICLSNTGTDLRLDPYKVVMGPNFYGTQLNVEYADLVPDLSTTPSVASRKYWRITNSGATSVTAFTNSFVGQELVIEATTANTTLVNGASIKLKGAVNVTLAIGNFISLVNFDGVFLETSRSF